LCVQLPATVVLLVLVVLRLDLGLVLAALVLVILGHGLVQPNLLTLGMQDEPEQAGSASALLGIAQFVLGGAAAPLIGLIGRDVAVGMATTMVALCASAALVSLRLPGAGRNRRNGRVTAPILPGHGPTVH
jgi:DHA1 family bicyclomycin/chloramphenicol resistance-like MFS transporter